MSGSGLPSCRPAAAQGPVAALQPPNRRDWPQHGLEMPIADAHVKATQWPPLAASLAEAMMPSVCVLQYVSGGTRSPIIVPTSVRKFHQAVTQSWHGHAGTSALVHPKACLRACCG